MSSPVTHFVFATGAPYSHAPAAVRLAVGIVTLDPSTRISMIIHANNTSTAESIIASAPAAQDKIRLWPVGSQSTLKECGRAYVEMVFRSRNAYADILLDTTWPTPTVYIFDITAFRHVTAKQSVEAAMPHIPPLRMVAYSPVPLSELIHLVGSEGNGSNRWIVRAAKERGIDLSRDLLLGGGEEGYSDRIAAAEHAQGRDEIFREICFRSDHLCAIPGVPPFRKTLLSPPGEALKPSDAYEYWSTKQTFSKPVQEGMMANIAGRPAITPAVEAWLTFFPSDVVEPGCVEAAIDDPHIGDKGKKPLFIAGPYEQPAREIGSEIKAFLDRHTPRSVVLVSFGTLVDAGAGADILFQELTRTGTPFVFATGGQRSYLPRETQSLIRAAEADGHAVAPEWVDQAAVLKHPVGHPAANRADLLSILCFVSHCGANSVVEALYAAVPIITWGRQWDQIINSSQIAARGFGIELVQHREGHGVGRPIAHRNGEIVVGDPKSLRRELHDAFRRIKGMEGDRIRQSLRTVAADMRSRRRSGGIWDEHLSRFIQWAKTGEAVVSE